MTILRARASVFTAPDFANPGNAVNAGDGTYATWTNAARRGATTGTFSGFDLSSIPAGSTINSVTAELRHYESSTGDMGSVTVDGSAVTLATAVRVDAVGLAAALPSSVAVIWTRGNNTRSTTCYADWLDVVVDYTEPPRAGAFNGTDYVVPEVWNGSRWVVPEVWNGSRWVTAGGL